MVNTLKLIKSHFGNTPFSPSEIKALGITPAQLRHLVEKDHLQRLNRGVYVLPDADLNDEAQFRAASLRVGGPSAVCLVSALAHYGLTDEIPKKVWLLVPENKHTTHKDIRLLRSRKPNWKIGIDAHEGYRITNIERTIVDAIAQKRSLGFQLGVSALKDALKDKKTTLAKIIKMATQLGLDHRIMSYIEALS